MAITKTEQKKIAGIFPSACAKKMICPVKDIMASYGDKWTMYTILLLGQHGKMRFNELRQGINGISQRMLTVTLRHLEEDGIITRHIFAEMPPRVEYELTELGESLLQQLLALGNWAATHFDKVLQARKSFRNRTNSIE